MKLSNNDRYYGTGETVADSRDTRKTYFEKKKIIREQEKQENIIEKDIISETILKSCEMGDYHRIHKLNQKNYENREIQRELSFINDNDNFFQGKLNEINELNWKFISKCLNRILVINSNGILITSSFDNSNSKEINLNKFFEKDHIIISCEFYENDIIPESKLLLLYNDFNFCTIDLFLLNIEDEKNENSMNSLEDAKGSYFNFKPYLNIPNVENYIPNYSRGIRILSFPKCLETSNHRIIINFTQISGRFIIFDFSINNIIANYIVNPEDFSNIDREYLNLIKYFIVLFFKKSWTISQYQYLVNLNKEINTDNNNFDNLKKLAILLSSNDEDEKRRFFEGKHLSFIELNNEILQSEKINYIYGEIILPIFTFSLQDSSIALNSFNLLNKITEIFVKIYSCSIASSKNDLSMSIGRFKIYQNLFLLCFNGDINLEKILKQYDPKNTGLISREKIISILKNFPIGLTDSDVEEILSNYYIFDEHNNYMFSYLLLLEEQQMTNIVFSSSQYLIPKNRFQCGYFKNNIIRKNNKKIKFKINDKDLMKTKRKNSFDFEYKDTIKEENIPNKLDNIRKDIPVSSFNFEFLIQYIINSCFHSELSDYIYLTNINLMFAIGPYDKNISIFKLGTEFSFLPKTLLKIGHINLNSYYNISPIFINYIPDKNLLISQQNTKTSSNLVTIDIYKDIFNIPKDNKYFVYNIRQKNLIKGLLKDNINTIVNNENNIDLSISNNNIENEPNIFTNFYYLERNELFVLTSNKNIQIINPKSQQFELSYVIESESTNIFGEILKSICEYPSEKTGYPPYQILKVIDLEAPLKQLFTFSYGNIILGKESAKNISSTDWIILLNLENEISSICINQLFITQKAKEVDNPIPKNDYNLLKKYADVKKMKSLLIYETQYLENIRNYYSMVYQLHTELVKRISTNTKETMLYDKEFIFDPIIYNVNTICELIKLIKEINLVYNYEIIYEMIPKLFYDSLTYDKDAEYLKTEIFPEKIDVLGDRNGFDCAKIPKRHNKYKPIPSLETYDQPIDSAIKKFARYLVIKGSNLNLVFKRLDENEEDIIDKKQFLEGCKKLNMLLNHNNYLTEGELKELFEHIDSNHSDCITLEELTKFFEKKDLDTIITKIKNEREGRLNDENFNFDIEHFVSAIEETKIEWINKALESIKLFYSEIISDGDIEYDSVKYMFHTINQNISVADLEKSFPNQIIFFEQFKMFLNKFSVNLDDEEMKKCFCYIDQNNKNMFIYTKDFEKYLNNNNESDIDCIFNNQYDKDQYILIWLSIIKKFIKYCIFSMEVTTNEFSDRFFLYKEINTKAIIINPISTKAALEKFEKKNFDFVPIEYKVFYTYLDLYSVGVLYRDELVSKFDNLMKIISDSSIFDFNKIDEIEDNTMINTYLNKKKINIMNQEKYYEEESIKQSLPIFDLTFSQFAYFTQSKSNMKDLYQLFLFFTQFDKDKDSFLTPEELEIALKQILPIALNNNILSKSIINQLSEYITFPNEPPKPYIGISRIILFIILIITRIQVLNPKIHFNNFNLCDYSGLNEKVYKCMNPISMYDRVGYEITLHSFEYLNYMRKGIFSGLIILNKELMCKNLLKRANDDKGKVTDYINYFMRHSNEILIDRFNKKIKYIQDRLKGKNYIEPKEYVNFDEIEIPIIRLNIIDTREMLNRKKYQCELIENFDFFHQELNIIVNITKFRKTHLIKEISFDGKNLLTHIENSLKVNHYLQKIYKEKKKVFPFIRNFGIYIKEVIINKKLEEEIYIINEKIDNSEYICLDSLLKSNGGLFQIPELSNTDMAFLILKSWAKKILKLLTTLNNINVFLRYFTLKDFYISHDGKRIKMRNLLSYSFLNEKEEIESGADIYKILLILDQLPISDVDELSDEKLKDTYDDAYLAPEFILIEPKNQTLKIDSWIFGVCMFNLLYGFLPISFFTQLKNWCDYKTNLNFDNVIKNLPYDLMSEHFFFNTFLNVEDIMEDKYYFIKVMKKKSFSALMKNQKDINLNENINSINILDMINACMSVDPNRRPNLNTLKNIFAFDQYEKILRNKFLSNVLNYYSPDIIIKRKILIPLRGICAEVMKCQISNPYEINNYENFIFNVIRELNTYLFSKTFSKNVSRNEDNISNFSEKFEEQKDETQNIFVKNPEYYFKNSMIIKAIIENKIFDVLIFLVLRHFTVNLKLFKKTFTNQISKIKKDNKIIDKQNIINQKKANYKKEMKNYCCKLLSALSDLLYNCIQTMTSYEHMLTLYVESILICVLKLFIGEENQLLSDICDNKNSNDKLKQYILLRTFLRDESVLLGKNFDEDELDKVFSVINSNRELHEIKSFWSPELYNFTIDLFREAFGDNCSGNFKHIVIKNYFQMMNSYAENLNNQIEQSPLIVNHKIENNLKRFGNQKMKLNYNFLNTTYIAEILSLANMASKIYSEKSNSDPNKNIINKRTSLSYINVIFKGKNEYKIRACLDFKVHFIIQEFLFTNISDEVIKNEVLNILKEISMTLIDMNEISWMFGNNYNRIFNSPNKKNDILELNENNDKNLSNWDSSFSLISFMNNLLNKPHSFILNFTNKFLIVNLQKDKGSYITFMKEFGLIFSSPLCLKPLMRTLQKGNEKIQTRQSCLDILFNLLMSNHRRIISNFNITMCNFYEILMSIIKSSITLPPNLKNKSEEEENLIKANNTFKNSVKQIIKILIELQNPYIRSQIFSSPSVLEYMEKNNMNFLPKLDIDEIEDEFIKLKDVLNFNGLEEKIIFLINTFKSYVFYLEKEKENENKDKIMNIISIISHIFNIEWNQGIKHSNKNCLVFNIIKLFEWLIKKEHIEFLFPKDNETTCMTMIISLLNKIKENIVSMKEITTKLNTITNSTNKLKNNNTMKNKKDVKINPFGNKSFTLQKIYNFITVKMINMILIIFSENDDYYNNIFLKVKFGSIVSELYKTQYETLSLFLNMDYIDTSILDNYMAEYRLRIEVFQHIINLDAQFDDIKMQFLQNEFINFMFNNLIYDMRKFKTDFKKLSIEFLPFKESFPIRAEAISLLNIIIRKFHNEENRTEIDCFIYDEVIRNVKISHMVNNELAIIKNKIKGLEVMSVMSLFNIILSNDDREIIKIMNLENAKNYFIYAIQKDTNIKKLYPIIVEYVNKVEAGIERK